MKLLPTPTRRFRTAIQIRRADNEEVPLVAGVLTAWCDPKDFEVPELGARFDLHVTFVNPETKDIIETKHFVSPGVNG